MSMSTMSLVRGRPSTPPSAPAETTAVDGTGEHDLSPNAADSQRQWVFEDGALSAVVMQPGNVPAVAYRPWPAGC